MNQLGLDPNNLSYFHGGLDKSLVGVEGADPIHKIIARVMKNLVDELYNSLRKNSSEVCVTDYSLDTPIHLSKKQILIMASALSKDIKKITNSNRVGIVIPSSAVGVIANLAVLFSEKFLSI